MGKYNKATAAAVANAIATVIGVVLGLPIEVVGAMTTVFTTFLVYLVPNKESI